MNSGSARMRTPGWPDDRGRRPVRPEEIVSLRIKEMLCAALLLASSSACSYQPTGGATIPSPLVAQVGGTWTGPIGLSQVSAPLAGTLQCVGNALQALQASAPSDTMTLIVSQDGIDLSGRLTTENSGLACSYVGTATPGAMVLNAPTCDAPVVAVRCANGEVHGVEVIGTTITATINNGVANGTLSQTYNVGGAGSFTTNSSLTVVRR
jgi:hypothetical protein